MLPVVPSVIGYVFPNELHVTWTVMIVLYPYITGLVAGAFIVSSLYHIFGRESLRPIARFALVSSLAFLLFAPLPLLLHLGRPERAFNILITPSKTSAMAGFGIIYLTYLVIVVIEVWLTLREDMVHLAESRTGFARLFYRTLTLFDTTIDEKTKAFDHKVAKFLAALGIPVACFLHGYVGFLFGSIKANPWWSTPLMFVIFLLSAIVSGIAVLVFLFYFVSWLRKVPIDRACVGTLASFLWGFMIVDVTLELLEVLSIAYQQTREWEPLQFLILHKLFFTYVVVQLLLCSLVPFLFLAFNAIAKPREKLSNVLVFSSAVLLLVQVISMRWNVVIGGQLLSKSFRGYTTYVPGLWNKEGLVVAAVVFIVPFILLRFVDGVISLFPADTPLGAWWARRAAGKTPAVPAPFGT